jgi:hypothetical protein
MAPPTRARGDAGNFVVVEINGQHTFWTARFGATSASTGCQMIGYLGGIPPWVDQGYFPVGLVIGG